MIFQQAVKANKVLVKKDAPEVWNVKKKVGKIGEVMKISKRHVRGFRNNKYLKIDFGL